MKKRVFISLDDRRGVRALEFLLQKTCLYDKADFTIVSLGPCSSKMKRTLNAVVREFDYVIVITDTEGRDPRTVAREIVERHGLTAHHNVKVIPVSPCLESWPCEALGLKNCGLAPCRAGPTRSISDYWMQRHGHLYEKRFLPDVFREAFSAITCGNPSFKGLPSTLREFIETLYAVLGAP